LYIIALGGKKGRK
jgi:four helix bundle protein